MNRRHFIQGALAAAGAFSLAAASLAHRVNSVATTVKRVAAEDSQIIWQITHQVHFHDAERALVNITGNPRLSLLDVKPRAQLLLHMTKEFALATGDGTPIPLDPIGGEVDGDYAYFYLSSAPIKTHTDLLIHNQLFTTLFDGQLNTVNVDAAGRVQTVGFVADTKAKAVSL